ncbi:Replicase polyprotein 1a [Linum perenne]
MEGKKKAPPLSKGAESSVVRKRTAENKKGKGVPTLTRSSLRIKGSSNPKTPATTTPSKRKQDHRPEDSDSDFQNRWHTNIKLAVLKTMIEECVDGNAFCRMYILHSLGTLLVPGNSWKITLNYAKYLNEDLSTLGTLNRGQYVLHLLDMVHLDGLSAPKSPTCAYWDDGRVSEAALMMKNNDGVWDFKLRRREQLKGFPLSEAPWLDELFETIPTQPTQDFATSSVRPVPTTFSGPTDGWAELVDVASADVGQLALMRQIAEAEVKYKRDELRGMEAHCRLWEATLTVIENSIKMKTVVVEDNTDGLDSQKNVEVENTEEKGEEDGNDDDEDEDEEDGKKGASDDDDDDSSDDDDGSSDNNDGSSDDDVGDDDAGDEGNEDDNDEDDGSEDDDDKEDGGDNEKKDKAVNDRNEDSSSSSSDDDDDDDDDDEEEDEEVYKD